MVPQQKFISTFKNAPQKAQLEIEKFGEQFVGADFIATEYGMMYSPIYENQYHRWCHL